MPTKLTNNIEGEEAVVAFVDLSTVFPEET